MSERREDTGQRREEDMYLKWNSRVRDGILFFVGVGGCINEIFIVSDPRPTLFLLLGALIGMPFVLGADERHSKARREGNGNSP